MSNSVKAYSIVHYLGLQTSLSTLCLTSFYVVISTIISKITNN